MPDYFGAVDVDVREKKRERERERERLSIYRTLIVDNKEGGNST